MPNIPVNTLDRNRLLDDLKDSDSRRLYYAEHISTGLPFQIRELRKKRNLTQKKLGELIGMDQSTISDIENPNYEHTPQIGTLRRLADAFDVPLIVRFGSWGELLEWEAQLSPEAVAPPKFEDDEKIKRAVKIAAAPAGSDFGTIQSALQGSEQPKGKLLEFPKPPRQGQENHENRVRLTG